MKLYPLLLFCFIFFSCKKSDGPSVESLLTGTNWHLTAYAENQVSKSLTVAQKHFTKSYTSNKNFRSSDGFVGTWQLNSSSELVETYANFPSGGSVIQSNSIVTITSKSLILQYTSNGVQITTTYSDGN